MCLLIGFLGLGNAGAAEFTDPMRPLNYRVATDGRADLEAAKEKEKTSAWRLTGVLLSAKRSVAIINGQSLQPGDILDGYTLKSIHENRVVLNGKGRRLVLKRAGTGLKKKTVYR